MRRPAILVSDSEREYTAGLLRGHLLAGRLTIEEFEQRVAEAWNARLSSDLWRALRQLPVDEAPTRAQPAVGTGAGALLTGVVALALLVFTLGLAFAVALPLSIVAWTVGRSTRRARERVGRGATLARSGEVLGILGTSLSVMALAGCAAVIAALF